MKHPWQDDYISNISNYNYRLMNMNNILQRIKNLIHLFPEYEKVTDKKTGDFWTTKIEMNFLINKTIKFI